MVVGSRAPVKTDDSALWEWKDAAHPGLQARAWIAREHDRSVGLAVHAVSCLAGIP